MGGPRREGRGALVCNGLCMMDDCVHRIPICEDAHGRGGQVKLNTEAILTCNRTSAERMLFSIW